MEQSPAAGRPCQLYGNCPRCGFALDLSPPSWLGTASMRKSVTLINARHNTDDGVIPDDDVVDQLEVTIANETNAHRRAIAKLVIASNLAHERQANRVGFGLT